MRVLTGHRLHRVRPRSSDSVGPSIVPRRLLLALACLMALTSILAFPHGALAIPGLKVTNLPLTLEESQLYTGPVARFTDPGSHTASEFTATIEWGDGVTDTATVSGAGEEFQVSTPAQGHIYSEEGAATLTVTVRETNGIFVFAEASDATTLAVADAPLSVPFSAPTSITGAGPGSGPGSAAAALGVFEAGIGGADNGVKPGGQSGGFRRINWDGVALNGSEPGAVTIVSGHTVAIPVDSQQNHGVELDSPIAVSNDAFTSVNASVTGLFGPLSPPNIAAPFNTNVSTLHIVSPSVPGVTPVSATTRAFGVTFLNVRVPNTTSVEYMSGEAVLAKLFAPVGGHDQPSFVGAVFSAPVVTSVVITMGTARIFSFDGTTSSPGLVSDNPPSSNLVAADDLILAEPAPDGLTLGATVGVPLSGVLASFQDTDPNGNAHDSLATIDWGDGSSSQGVIEANAAGSFNVSGTHTYSQAGTMRVTVTARDLGGAQLTLHATVTVAPGTTPVATVPPAGGPSPNPAPPPRCLLTAPKALSRTGKHKATKSSLRVGVRCDEDASVTVTATATLTGTGKKAHKALAHPSVKTTVRTLTLGRANAAVSAGHPVTLTIPLSASLVSKLTAAIARHQRITVRLLLTAMNAHGKSTATATVSALKLR